MKNKSIVSLFIGLLGLGVSTTSCEDMLTPDLDRYVENFSGTDTVNFYLGILGNVQDVVENNVLLGELRGDLADTTMYVSDSIADISNFVKVEDAENSLLSRAAYYKVINQCNFYIATCDTMAMKNNNYYMRREYAQVQMIRAWTYLQLVQNYGRVPFITQPVDNANTGWETNPENWATPDNLLDLLRPELERAYAYEKTYGLPDYGNMNTGSVNVAQRKMVFPGDLVLGDLYLLRGASLSDYEQAARYYYTYLDDYCDDHGAGVLANIRSLNEISSSGVTRGYYTGCTGWASFIGGYSDNENVTVVASAANSSFGRVLTRVAQVYGFDATSTTSTTAGDDDESATNSGSITLRANYRNRQVAPSQRYINLSRAQLQLDNHLGESYQITGVDYIENVGDGREAGTFSRINTDMGMLNFVTKTVGSNSRSTANTYGTGSFSFSYVVPVYRVRQVFLRFAEAINRAGYPRYAFAILRNGLNYDEIPTVRTDSILWDDVAQTGKVIPYTMPIADGCNYIDVNELRRAQSQSFLNFSNNYWVNTGIHELGCGETSDYDTLYDYVPLVAERMLAEAQRTGNVSAVQPYIDELLATVADEPAADEEAGETTDEGDTGEEGDETTEPDRSEWPVADPDEPTIPEGIAYQINAVETLIADEMALETGFEGFRYYDLMRMARHKNNDIYGGLTAGYGTEWFAWTIARRSVDLAPYESTGVMNSTLYNTLLNVDNWYLQNPEY